MTCKNCLCFDVCAIKKIYYANKPFKNGNIDKDNLIFQDSVENKCKHFKDKSRFIELPCKEGENLYYVSKFNTIGCFLNVSYETILMCVSDCRNREKIYISKNREECEEKLKELKQ